MQKILVPGALFLAIGAMGVTKVVDLDQRLSRVDRLADEVPQRTRALDQRLGQVADELGHLRGELEQRAGNDEALHAALERMARLEQGLRESQASETARAEELVQLREASSGLRGELERARDDLQAERRRLDGITEVVSAVARSAEEASLSVDDLSRYVNTREVRTDRWERIVAPTVQLNGSSTVGSGVVLESRPLENGEGHRTLLLTAWHVVRDIRADSIVEDPPIPVDLHLENGVVRHETATLLAHDAALDAAVLELDTRLPIEHGARLATRAELARSQVFDEIYAVGCPLGNDPIPTRGELSDLAHHVDGGEYWMISAPTYIGNSGGGIYDGESNHLLGVFSKIYTHGSLRPTVVPHMGLVVPLAQVYDWLEEVEGLELEETEGGIALVRTEAPAAPTAALTPEELAPLPVPGNAR